jgi:FkbM family methyltransferase
MGQRTIRTSDGFLMRLDLRDWVDQHIFAVGHYEPDVVAVVKTALLPGGCAIDVGANVGYFSLLFAHLVGPTGRALSFEPQPSAFERLAANIALNPSLAVKVHRVAASDERGFLDFYCGPPDHSGVASIRDHGQSGDRLAVATTPIDDVLDADRPVNLLKIDVEGAEMKVVAGARRTIERWRPDVIVEVSESFLRQMGSSGAELCDVFFGRGYRMFGIRWDGIRECHGWHPDLPDQFNALFTTNPTRFRALVTQGAKF